MSETPVTTPGGSAQVLFAESGASWYWLLAGPVAGLAMLVIQLSGGLGLQPVVPIAFLVLVSGFVALQVKAARIHTSVELTADALRQGAETVLVDEILTIYPAPPYRGRSYYSGRMPKNGALANNALANRALRKAGVDEADLQADLPADSEASTEASTAADTEADTVKKWQASRALGELTGVPRGRVGIGLKLTGGRTAQAWARHHGDLRAALTQLVEGRGPQAGST